MDLLPNEQNFDQNKSRQKFYHGLKCSRLTLNITVIKQKLTFKENICHRVLLYYILGDIFPSFLHYKIDNKNTRTFIKV
jgi:hypothetical protein